MFPNNGNYIIEDHIVQTEDGYLLTLFKVTLSEKAKENLEERFRKNERQPVLLQHGMTSSAEVWNFGGEGYGTTFKLLDRGFDVWLGNNRGTKHSRQHVKDLEPSDFFKFSFQQMGAYDLRAFYDRILADYPKETKIIYFGHSMGTTQFFCGMLDSVSRDFLAQKTKHYVAYAPCVWFYKKNDHEKINTNLVSDHKKYIQTYQSEEISPAPCSIGKIVPYPDAQAVEDYFKDKKKKDCNLELDYEKALYDDVAYNPNGSTSMCQDHYDQIWDNEFKMFDYGIKENLKKYGSSTAPSYDWSYWPKDLPVTNLIGEFDPCGTQPYIDGFKEKIGTKNVTFNHIPGWGHMDYMLAADKSKMWDAIDKDLG